MSWISTSSPAGASASISRARRAYLAFCDSINFAYQRRGDYPARAGCQAPDRSAASERIGIQMLHDRQRQDRERSGGRAVKRGRPNTGETSRWTALVTSAWDGSPGNWSACCSSEQHGQLPQVGSQTRRPSKSATPSTRPPAAAAQMAPPHNRTSWNVNGARRSVAPSMLWICSISASFSDQRSSTRSAPRMPPACAESELHRVHRDRRQHGRGSYSMAASRPAEPQAPSYICTIESIDFKLRERPYRRCRERVGRPPSINFKSCRACRKLNVLSEGRNNVIAATVRLTSIIWNGS